MPISVARAARRNQQNGGSHRKPFTHECRLEAREARSVGVSRSRGHRAEGVCGLIRALRSALYIPTLVCGQCLFESLLHAFCPFGGHTHMWLPYNSCRLNMSELYSPFSTRDAAQLK